ncbi:YdeI/OmpD-associated family protein [Sorangium sp. So ce1128]
MSDDLSGLKRPRYPMPDFVQTALDERGLMDAYKQRPAYQQNDYIGWIVRAKRQETKESRLLQMLDELESGGVYMNMKHAASEKKSSRGA